MCQLKHLSLLLGLLLLGPSSLTFAQSVRFQSQAISSRGAGIANATVAVCSQPANTNTQPCSPLATLATSTSTTSGGANPLTADSFGNFFFYAAPGRYTVQIYGPAVFTPFVMPDVEVASLAGGTAGTLKNLNNIRFADQFAGADCGAKINAADTDLGATSGEIWVNQNCGTTWTTAVSISGSHGIRFIQGGTYTTSATITLNAPSPFIIGGPIAESTGNATFGQAVIKEANAANLPAVVKCVGSASQGGCTLQNITIDGNKANQTCPSPPCYGVWNFKSVRPGFGPLLSVQNAFSAGIMIESSAWPANESCCGDIVSSMILNNGGSALKVLNSSDVNITQVHFENSNIGAELIDAPNKRFANADFGGNTLNGIKLTCTGVDAGSGMILVNSQFGNNLADDIFIDAWTGSAQCAPSIGSVITGNQFVSGASRTANTFDAIKIQNSKFNSITGNNCNPAPGATTFKYCIEFLSPNTAEGRDMVVGNSLQGAGTGTINPAAATYALGNSAANSTISDGALTVATSGVSALYSQFPETTAPAASTGNDFCYGDSTAHVVKCSYNNGSFLTVPQVIASGTATLNSGALATNTCQATVTTTATGAATTDAIEWAFATVPASADGLTTISVAPTANNVNFVRCNASSASQTTTAIVINWRVLR